MDIFHAVTKGSSFIEPEQELANAVIVRAADDYRLLGKMLNSETNDVNKRHVEQAMESIRTFFLSKWFCMLSESDNGADVLKMLDEEVFGGD